MESATATRPLTGIELDMEVLRVVRDHPDRTPANVHAALGESLPHVPWGDVLQSIDRLTKATD